MMNLIRTIEFDNGESMCIARIDGALVGIDATYIEQEIDVPYSPYDGKKYDFSEEVLEDLKMIDEFTDKEKEIIESFISQELNYSEKEDEGLFSEQINMYKSILNKLKT